MEARQRKNSKRSPVLTQCWVTRARNNSMTVPEPTQVKVALSEALSRDRRTRTSVGLSSELVLTLISNRLAIRKQLSEIKMAQSIHSTLTQATSTETPESSGKKNSRKQSSSSAGKRDTGCLLRTSLERRRGKSRSTTNACVTNRPTTIAMTSARVINLMTLSMTLTTHHLNDGSRNRE